MHSEQMDKIAESLAKAQGEFPVLEKKSKAYNYMYADLAETIQAIQEPLQTNGLSIHHSTVLGEMPLLRSTLLHASGQWIYTDTPLFYKADGKINTQQAYGSAITYAKRYAIGCLLNLAADKESDDDGVKACPKDYEPSVPSKIKEKVILPHLEPWQLKIVEKYLIEFPEAKSQMLDKYKVDEISEIPCDRFKQIVAVFEERKRKKLESEGSYD